MSVRWYVVTATDTLVEITDRVRKPDPDGVGGFAIGANAEEGSGGSFSLQVDDPDADLHLLNHRRVYAIAEDAPAGHQRVGNWWISDLDVVRGDSDRTGASRTWQLQMEDENSIIPRKIFVGADVDRPAETDIERIDWWMTTTEGAMVKDDLYLDRTGPKNLDKSDLTGQTADTMLTGCKDASGKNYFIWFNEAAIAGGTIVSSSVANPTVITTSAPHDLLTGAEVTIAGHTGSTPTINGVRTVTVTSPTTFTIPVNVTVGGTGGTVVEPRYSLAYFNFNTYDQYVSDLSLTNVESEVRAAPTTVYPIANGDETRLNRAGGRIASGNFKPFSGGNVYVQNIVTRDTYISRDVATPAINTKSVATATTEATRQLTEMNEPDDEVTTWILVEEAAINEAMHGMQIPLKATHFPDYLPGSGDPGYSVGTTMRITRRTVTQISPEWFRVGLVLTPCRTPVVPGAVLWRGMTDDDYPPYVGAGEYPIAWECSGDHDIPACSAYPIEPTVGPLHTNPGSISDPNIPPSTGPLGHYLGITFEAEGTVDVHFKCHVFGALDGVPQRIDLLLDGVIWATGTGTSGVPTPTAGCDIEITETGLAVTAGSVLTGLYTHGGAAAFYLDTPLGDETESELRITGGSLLG